MSSNDIASETGSCPKLFTSQEFMDFLAEQAGDIAKLELTTKSGDRISASFNGTQDSSANTGVFKSLDLMKSFISVDSASETGASPAAKPSGAATLSGSTSNFLTSKDWSVEYAPNHVDVTYGKLFSGGSGEKDRPQAPTEATLPPKKRGGKTDWSAMYDTALSPLVEAAVRAQPQPVKQSSASKMKLGAPGQLSKNTAFCEKKRRSRKIIPDQKEYVEKYTERGKT